jgi:cell wall-associated NlpC family hydrolase
MPSTRIDAPSRAQNAPASLTDSAHNANSPTPRAHKTGFGRRISSIAIAASVAASTLVAAPAILQTSSAAAVEVSGAADKTTPVNTSGAAATAAATSATATQVKKTKKKASVKLKFSKKIWTKGTKPGKLTVNVKADGKAATGKIQVFSGKKRLKTLTLKNGKASYTFSKKLTAKRHTLTVKYIPSGASKKVAKTTAVKSAIRVKQSKSQKIVAEAKKHVGVRYRSGGSSPKSGFDCSGFTTYVYKKAVGKNLPRTSSAQRTAGKKISKKNAQPGDIVWTPGHVAIYLGNDKIIDAPRPGKTIQVRKMYQKNPTFIRL